MWRVRGEAIVEAEVEPTYEVEVDLVAAGDFATVVDAAVGDAGVGERAGLTIGHRRLDRVLHGPREGDDGQNRGYEGSRGREQQGVQVDHAVPRLCAASICLHGAFTPSTSRPALSQPCCQQPDKGQSEQDAGLLQPGQDRPAARDMNPHSAGDVARRRPRAVRRGVVVTLHHEAAVLLADEAMEDQRMVQMVGDDVPDVIGGIAADDDEIALVDERIHADPARDDVGVLTAELRRPDEVPGGQRRDDCEQRRDEPGFRLRPSSSRPPAAPKRRAVGVG